MKTYLVTRENTIGIRVGNNKKDILRRERLKMVRGEKLEIVHAKKADIEWVRYMGGHIPNDAEKYCKD